MPKKRTFTTFVTATSLLGGVACDNNRAPPKNPLPPAANSPDFGDIEDEAYAHGSYVVPGSELILAQIKISVGNVPNSGTGIRTPEQTRQLQDQLAIIGDSYKKQSRDIQRIITGKVTEMKETLSPRNTWKYDAKQRRQLLAEILAANAPAESRDARMQMLLTRLEQNPEDERRAQKWISDGLEMAGKQLERSPGR